MSARRRKFEVWTAISLALFLMFAVFFIYPICTLLRQAFTTKEAAFTLDNFVKFFSKPYYLVYGTSCIGCGCQQFVWSQGVIYRDTLVPNPWDSG